MAVRKRQTAWDILTKLALKTVRTRFETIESGSKQKQNERFAWDLPQNTASDSVRNKRMAVRKRQSAWAHATTAFGCILAITSAMLKKGKTLITPMENFIALTCRENLVDHVVFPSCSNRRRRRRLRRTTSCRCTKRARR